MQQEISVEVLYEETLASYRSAKAAINDILDGAADREASEHDETVDKVPQVDRTMT